jgi:hypothetical protein
MISHKNSKFTRQKKLLSNLDSSLIETFKLNQNQEIMDKVGSIHQNLNVDRSRSNGVKFISDQKFDLKVLKNYKRSFMNSQLNHAPMNKSIELKSYETKDPVLEKSHLVRGNENSFLYIGGLSKLANYTKHD